jgi:hypothetical protein
MTQVAGNGTNRISASANHGNADGRPRPETIVDAATSFVNATLVTDQKALTETIGVVARADAIGLDIETTGYDANYHPNGVRPTDGTVRTIQIAVRAPEPRQYVVDCWRVDPTPLLDAIFNTPAKPWQHDPERETVVHYAWFEAEWLAHHYGVTLGKIFDTCAATRKLNSYNKAQRASRRRGETGRNLFADVDPTFASTGEVLPDAKLATVAGALLGVTLEKALQSAPWDQRRLTTAQVEYAALDAAVLLELAPILKERCDAAGVTADVEAASDKAGKAGAHLREKHGTNEWSRLRAHRALSAAESFDQATRVARFLGQLPLRWDDRIQIRRQAMRRADELLSGGAYEYNLVTNGEERRRSQREPSPGLA